MRWLPFAALLVACSKPSPPAEAPEAAPATAQTKPVAVAKKAAPAAPHAELPASDRVFAVKLLEGEVSQLLGARRDRLWAFDPASGETLWEVKGPGVAQRVAVGDYGSGRKLYVAWGSGRDFLRVPLVLQALDPRTGASVELWRFQGPRTECAHLSVADVDRDGKPELAFAHYETKYFVRTRHLKTDGAVIEGPRIRMASSRVYGDVDGDGLTDEVIGRVYGDEKGVVGDVQIDRGKGRNLVPGVDRGIKAVAVADLDGKGPLLYFSDGWAANYGMEARAQLGRVRFVDGKPKIDRLGTSFDEFTFFEIIPLDVDGDGLLELAVRGDKRVSLFKPTASGPWARRTLAEVPPILNVAVARTAKGPFVYIPDKKATKAVPIR